MQELRNAAARLGDLANQPLAFLPDFQPLAAGPLPARTVAVDGSAALLADNGAVWVAAVRAEALWWPGQRPFEPPTRIVAATPSEAGALLEAEYAAAGFEAPRAGSADAWAGSLQALAEWTAAAAALPRRPDLLLIDGALRGLPRHAQPMADALAERAQAAGVPLVAVAKRSGIGDALVPRLTAAGPLLPWSVAVPGEAGVHVARLHAQAAQAFRVDAARREHLSALLPLCRDVAYLGYPYPLALVHNRVAFTGGRVAELKAGLERELRLRGSGAAGMARDFHDVLDRNVSG